jgi:hypothetical protein
MLFKSLRVAIFFVVVASLSYGCSGANLQPQYMTNGASQLISQAEAISLVTGIIYSQPVSPNGGLLQSSWITPGGSGNDQYVWDNFTLQTTQTITNVTWIGGYDPLLLGSGGPVLDFTVAIYASIPGGSQPDVVNPPLVKYATGGNASETLHGTLGGVTMYDYAFLLPTPFTATAGTKYWVQIEAFQQGTTPDWGITVGTGSEGWHYRRIHGDLGDLYQFVPADAAFTLLGPVPGKITPTVTWGNPADITYGTALSGIQLNATASVPGTFVYTPAAGTVLNAGAGQILSVDFTPTDMVNYNSVLGTTVTINVNKATPTVTWSNPADITYGTALSGTQLNATASVPGTFVYTPPAGTILNAGAGQILSVDFTPTDMVNYNSVLGTTVTINVIKTTPTNTPGNMTGGGVIGSDKGGNKVTFGFTIKYNEGDSAPKGNLTYQDHKTNLRLKATSFDLLAIEGNHAWFTGTGVTNDGQVVRFTVEIDALSKLGQLDTFYIFIPALNGYESGGALTGGNVTIHK